MALSDRLRTLLFVPASRPDRFSKAFASGADAIIIDLEDAVAPEAKATARENLSRLAHENPQRPYLVRVNDARTPWFEADLAACRALPGLDAIMLPKAESADQLVAAADLGCPVLPLIESAAGLLALPAIANAPGVARLTFGALDLMLDLGVTPDTAAATLLLNQVRCQLLIQSRASHLLPPVDSVYPDFSDVQGLATAARLSCEMGYGGMLCIHPAQVPVVHQAFMPTETELAWARRVVEQAGTNGGSAFKLDGAMVDLPVIERARRVLARAAVPATGQP